MKTLLQNASKFYVMLPLLALIAFGFTKSSGDEWKVPANYDSMKNPIASNAESLELGESLYNQHCKSCHGKYGEGDGPKAAELETSSGDFTTEEFQNQSDGSLFYKTIEGRDDMPSYRKKIQDDEDVWHVVNFMRSLGEN